MRKKLWIAGLALLLVIVASGIALSQYNWWYPRTGQPVVPVMGPGMMGPMMGRGMMGPWMMGRGYGTWSAPMMGPAMCPMMGYWADAINRGWAGSYYGTPRTSPLTITIEEATTIVKDYLASTRNPNLKIGEVKELDDFFKVEIVTKDGSLVDEILVDRRTGLINSVY